MNILLELVSIANFIIFFYIFFQSELNTKHLFLRILAIYLSATVTLFVWNNTGHSKSLFMVSTMIEVLCIFFTLSSSPVRKFLSFLFCYSVNSLLEVYVEYICITVNTQIRMPSNILSSLFSLSILLIFVFLVHFKRLEICLSNISLFCVTILSILFCTVVILSEDEIKNESVSFHIIFICSVLSCFAVLIVIILDISSQHIQKEKNMLIKHIASMRSYEQALRDSEEEFHIYRHDMRHHFSVISSLATNKDYTGLIKYISECDTHIQYSPSPCIDSGNHIADAIITDFALKARGKNIVLKYTGSFPDNLNISDFNLCVILSNILENAVEYCSVNDFHKIQMTVVSGCGLTVIEVRNPISDIFDVDSAIKTTNKTNHVFHGQGIKSVKKTALSINGTATFIRDGYEFVARIVIPDI